MRLAQIVQLLNDRNQPRAIVTSARPQFGTAALPLIGATLLPERLVQVNMYRERSIIFRAVIASNIGRYSPPPKESSHAVGGWTVETATSGRKADLTAEDLDVLNDLLGSNMDFEAAQQVLAFVTTGLTLPVMQLNERQRWNAMVDGIDYLTGENAAREPVRYPNPAGNRVVLGTLWDNPTADAVADFFAMIDHMKGKGIQVRRIFASTRMRNRFLANQAVQKLLGGIVIAAGGNLTIQASRANASRLDEYLQREGLPAIEVNDQQYRTTTGTARYLRDTAMVFIGATGLISQIDLGDNQQAVLPDTLGYFAIGKPAGRTVAGRHVLVRAYDDHPPRVEGEIVQEGITVITQPDAIGVISET